MIIESAVNIVLVQIINLLVGIEKYAMRSRQNNAIKPSGAFATVGLLTNVSRGWEQQTLENSLINPDLVETLEGMRELTYSINFYRDGAYDNAAKVRIGFMRESIRSVLHAAGLGLGIRSPIRDISGALENEFEERTQFDVTLSAVNTDSDAVLAIATVAIAGIYEARGLAYNLDITNEE